MQGDDKKRRKGSPEQPGQDVRNSCEENRRSKRTWKQVVQHFAFLAESLSEGPPRIHPGLISQLRLQLIIKQAHSISTAGLAAARPVLTPLRQETSLLLQDLTEASGNDSPKIWTL